MRDLDDKGAGVADAEEKDYPAEGDWVLVWGQIKSGQTHPEDVLVEFFSHNEQWAGHVKTDRIVATADMPDFVTTCTAMFAFAGGPNGLFVRCVLHDQHGEKHRDGAGTSYEESQVVGYFEER